MAEEKAKQLMAEFPPVTTAEWEEVIAKDLKGADRTKSSIRNRSLPSSESTRS